MSVKVDIDELPAVLGELDPAAFVCTAAGTGGPKVVHALLDVTADGLRVVVGRGTVDNARAGAAVTVVIPGATPHDMSLLVDADAEVVDETTLVLRPSTAVWHRSAHGASR